MKLSFIIGLVVVTGFTARLAEAQYEYAPFAQLKQVPAISIPDDVIKSGLGGEVRVYVKVDKEGNVGSVEAVYGPGPVCAEVTRPDVIALRNAAKEAAKGATFEPPRKNQSFAWVRFEIPQGKGSGDEEKLRRFILSPDLPTLRDKIVSLPKPPYPPAARAVRASGTVTVELLVDESGDVFSSKPVSGHPLLRGAASMAACGAKFRPTSGIPAKAIWMITYNFVP